MVVMTFVGTPRQIAWSGMRSPVLTTLPLSPVTSASWVSNPVQKPDA